MAIETPRVDGSNFGDQKKISDEAQNKKESKEQIENINATVEKSAETITAAIVSLQDFIDKLLSGDKKDSKDSQAKDVLGPEVLKDIIKQSGKISNKDKKEAISSIKNLKDIIKQFAEVAKDVEKDMPFVMTLSTNLGELGKSLKLITSQVSLLSKTFELINKGISTRKARSIEAKVKIVAGVVARVNKQIRDIAEKNTIDEDVQKKISNSSELTVKILEDVQKVGKKLTVLALMIPLFALGIVAFTIVASFLGIFGLFLLAGDWIAGKLKAGSLENIKKVTDGILSVVKSVEKISWAIVSVAASVIVLGLAAIAVTYVYKDERVYDGLHVIQKILKMSILVLGALALIQMITGTDGSDMIKTAATLPIIIAGCGLASIVLAWSATVIASMDKAKRDEGLTTILYITGIAVGIIFALAGIQAICGNDADDMVKLAALVPGLIFLIGLASLATAWFATLIGGMDQERLKTGWKVMGVLTTGAFIIIVALSLLQHWLDNDPNDMIKLAAIIPGIILAVGLASYLTAKLAVSLVEMGSKRIWEGLGIMGTIALAGLVMVGILSLIAKKAASLGKIVLALAVLSAVILGVTGVVYLVTKVAKHIAENSKVIWSGLGQMAAIFTLTVTVLGVIGALITSSMPVLLIISAGLLIASGVIWSVTSVIEELVDSASHNQKVIDQMGGLEKFTESVKGQYALVGAAVGAITESLADLGVIQLGKAAVKANEVRAIMHNVSAAISDIFGLIVRMERMIIAVPDGNGGFKLKKIDTSLESMVSYANTLSMTIMKFLDNLIGEDSVLLKNLDRLEDNSVKIVNALMGQKKWHAFITNKRDPGLFDVLDEIFTMLERVSKFRFIAGQDANGNSKYIDLGTPDKLIQASGTLASTIVSFIKTLVNGLSTGINEDLMDRFADVAVILLGGTKKDFKLSLSEGFSRKKYDLSNGGLLQAANLIIKTLVEAGKLPKGVDFKAMGGNVARSITGFLSALSEGLDTLLDDDTVKKIQDSVKVVNDPENGVMRPIYHIVEAIKKTDEVQDFGPKSITVANAINRFVTAMLTAFSSIDQNKVWTVKNNVSAFIGDSSIFTVINSLLDIFPKLKEPEQFVKNVGIIIGGTELFISRMLTAFSENSVKNGRIKDAVKALINDPLSIANAIRNIIQLSNYYASNRPGNMVQNIENLTTSTEIFMSRIFEAFEQKINQGRIRKSINALLDTKDGIGILTTLNRFINLVDAGTDTNASKKNAIDILGAATVFLGGIFEAFNQKINQKRIKDSIYTLLSIGGVGILRTLRRFLDLVDTDVDTGKAKTNATEILIATTIFMNGIFKAFNQRVRQNRVRAAIKALTEKDGIFDAVKKLIDIVDGVKTENFAQNANAITRATTGFMKELTKPIMFLDIARIKINQQLFEDTIEHYGRVVVKSTKLAKNINKSIKTIKLEELTKKFKDLTEEVKKFNEELVTLNKLSLDNQDKIIQIVKYGDEGSHISTNTGFTTTTGVIGNPQPEGSHAPVVPGRYVALDSNTMLALAKMFQSVQTGLMDALSGAQSKEIFVDLNSNVYKGKVSF